MRKELLSEWIEALRSGLYKQGKGVLRLERNDGRKNPTHLPENSEFCCLGVLCEVAGLRSQHEALDPDYNGWPIAYKSGKTSCYQVLPTHFQDEIGMSGEFQQLLTEFNDDLGYSFEDIADWLEANVIALDDTDHCFGDTL